jgi:hypothetical protein
MPGIEQQFARVLRSIVETFGTLVDLLIQF